MYNHPRVHVYRPNNHDVRRQYKFEIHIVDFEIIYRATVCKTVRSMLSDRCPVCLSYCQSVLSCPVLSVTLVYCGQTVRRVKMKLGMQVGLVPGHIVLDGNPAPSPLKEHSPPQFSAHICCGQMAECIKMSLGMEVGLGQGDFVLDWYPAPLPKKGAERPPPKKKLRPMFSVAKRLDGSRWHLAWR